MYDEVVFKEIFMPKYCHNRCKTQEMFVKAVDVYLPSLKFRPDWFVTNKMLENLDGAVFFNDDIVFADRDSNTVTFFSSGTSLNTIHLNNINLDNDNVYYYVPGTVIHVQIMAWHNRYEKRKAHK